MNPVTSILKKEKLERNDIINLLSVTDPDSIEQIRFAAEKTLLEFRGSSVYFRGLIEFSNICSSDCYYCGIRNSNKQVERYLLTKEQILSAALWCAENGYGSVVLQSGERRDKKFIEFVTDIVNTIKNATKSSRLPYGLGITLCVGEQTRETYQKFFDAGAHRYLLRIETSSADLFSSIHPVGQTFKSRVHCLSTLKEVGFLVGTGVMIGLPGQSIETLADDILFFQNIGVDMIGMGPYIIHEQTPMAVLKKQVDKNNDYNYLLALKMISVTRLLLKNINIASTTALQALKPDGREQGLRFGANVIMPQSTPQEFRKNYLLYEGKPCIDENAAQCKNCLTQRIQSMGRTIILDSWGDRRSVIKND